MLFNSFINLILCGKACVKHSLNIADELIGNSVFAVFGELSHKITDESIIFAAHMIKQSFKI